MIFISRSKTFSRLLLKVYDSKASYAQSASKDSPTENASDPTKKAKDELLEKSQEAMHRAAEKAREVGKDPPI